MKKFIFPVIAICIAATSVAVWAQSFPKPKQTSAQIGRYQFVPASNEMPAVVFDTATGCTEFIEKYTLDKSPNAGVSSHPNRDGTRYVWIRQIEDEVISGTPKRCVSVGSQ